MTQEGTNVPREGPAKERGSGFVRAVSSGDCLQVVVLGKAAQNGPPPILDLTLSSCSAPRVGRRDTPDAPFAWEAREFLRKKLIGKVVNYTVEHKGTGTRVYSTVYLGEENINQEVAKAGWATVHQPRQGEARGALVELLALAQQAEDEKKGMHDPSAAAKEASVRTVHSGKFDAFSVYNALRNRDVQAQVDYVRSGTTFRLLVRTDPVKAPSVWYNVTAKLAGARAPDFGRDASEPNAPFAEQAKFFAEQALLHREITVRVTGLDKQDNFTVTAVHGGKDVATELIRQGYAQFVNWNAPPAVSKDMLALEKAAQAQKIRIWKSYVAPTKDEGDGATSFSIGSTVVGKVTEIQDAGTLSIRDDTNPSVVHVCAISSIIVPRLRTQDGKPENFAWEAREFLRKKLLGKRITARVDYVRPANVERKMPPRPMWSILMGATNIAVTLIERGLAKVVIHRMNDDRSPDYEQYLINERVAAKKGRGIHTTKEVPAFRINELTSYSRDDTLTRQTVLAKAKAMLPFLQRSGRLPAIVEYCYSSSRFKVFIEKESCMINVSLSAVRSPSAPFAEAATAFARDALHQRDVEIEIESQDKGGSFTGAVFIKKVNFGTQALLAGQAGLHGPSLKYSPYENDFVRAEKDAKKAHVGQWVDWDETAEQKKKEAEQKEAAERVAGKKEIMTVLVTEIVDGSSFYVQNETALPKLEELMTSLADAKLDDTPAHNESTSQTVFPRARNQIVAAKFEADDRWYRAKITAVPTASSKNYVVLFLDYGNSDQVPISSLRPIPSAMATPPAFATLAHLAFCNVPSLDDDFGEDAAYFLSDLVINKKMMANVEYRDGTSTFLSLGDPASQTHVNATLVRAGLARVEQRRDAHLQELLSKLKEEEEHAHREHAGVWCFGYSAGDDEDEGKEFGARR